MVIVGFDLASGMNLAINFVVKFVKVAIVALVTASVDFSKIILTDCFRSLVKHYL